LLRTYGTTEYYDDVREVEGVELVLFSPQLKLARGAAGATFVLVGVSLQALRHSAGPPHLLDSMHTPVPAHAKVQGKAEKGSPFIR
jgi:hypothetical protein